MDKKSGYVYLLINPSMDGIVKVGKTTRDPENRVNELSSATGVPTPFILIYKEYFEDCHIAENKIHEILSEKYHRVSANREFFEAPVYDVIKVIQNVKNRININNSTLSAQDKSESKDNYVDDIAYQIYQKALKYWLGEDDYLQDYEKALNLFKRAANMGVVDAYYYLGEMYLYGNGCREDINQSLEYFKKGAENGDNICFGKLASLYLYETKFRSVSNARKCWGKYFNNLDINNLNRIDYDLFKEYIVFLHFTGENGEYLDIIRQREDQLFEIIQNELENNNLDSDYRYYLTLIIDYLNNHL